MLFVANYYNHFFYLQGTSANICLHRNAEVFIPEDLNESIIEDNEFEKNAQQNINVIKEALKKSKTSQGLADFCSPIHLTEETEESQKAAGKNTVTSHIEDESDFTVFEEKVDSTREAKTSESPDVCLRRATTVALIDETEREEVKSVSPFCDITDKRSKSVDEARLERYLHLKKVCFLSQSIQQARYSFSFLKELHHLSTTDNHCKQTSKKLYLITHCMPSF